MMESLRALQEARLRRTVELCERAHPYYRRLFKECGLTAKDLRSLEDLERLPLTYKKEYMADPESFRLSPRDLPQDVNVEERVLWDVAYTTGTTSGTPSPFYNTTHDYYGLLVQARECSLLEGVTEADLIANLYPMAGFPTGAFLSTLRAGAILGAPVVSALTGTPDAEFSVKRSLQEAISLLERSRATVLWGVPSFVRRLLVEARGRGADLSSVRLCVTSGERVTPSLREEMKEHLRALGAKAPEVRARYAFTEMQGGFVQCAEKADPQNAVPDLYYLEVVEEGTGRRLKEGEKGLLVLTHLHRRGTVLLRYVVGDVTTLSRASCPHCGRMGERAIEPPSRKDDLVKVKGMLVNPNLIQEALASLPGLLEYQIVFRRQDPKDPHSPEEILLRLAAAEPPSQKGFAAPEGRIPLEEEAIRRVQRAVAVRPRVEFVDSKEIFDPERSIKAPRIVDLRTSKARDG